MLFTKEEVHGVITDTLLTSNLSQEINIQLLKWHIMYGIVSEQRQELPDSMTNNTFMKQVVIAELLT